MPGACIFTGKMIQFHLSRVTVSDFPMWFRIPLLLAQGRFKKVQKSNECLLLFFNKWYILNIGRKRRRIMRG